MAVLSVKMTHDNNNNLEIIEQTLSIIASVEVKSKSLHIHFLHPIQGFRAAYIGWEVGYILDRSVTGVTQAPGENPHRRSDDMHTPHRKLPLLNKKNREEVAFLKQPDGLDV